MAYMRDADGERIDTFQIKAPLADLKPAARRARVLGRLAARQPLPSAMRAVPPIASAPLLTRLSASLSTATAITALPVQPLLHAISLVPTGILSAALSTGSAITALPVQPLPSAIASGSSVVTTSGANSQTWTLTADAAAGATSLAVTSQTPNFAYGSSSPVKTYPSVTITAGTSAQTWKVAAAATAGATALTVVSATPNATYPVGTPVASETPTAQIQQNTQAQGTALATQHLYSAGKVSVFGGVPTVSSPGYVFPSRFFSTAGGGVPTPDYWTAEAVVDAEAFGFYFFGSNANGLRVAIDGELVTQAPLFGGSGYNVLRVDVGGVRRPRQVTIEGWGGGNTIIGFVTTGTGTCAPTKPEPIRGMFVGDSVADGTGCAWNGDGYPRTVGQLLGVSDMRVSANGGTGFIAINGTGIQNFQTRVADIIANGPLDFLVTCMSSNDYSQTTSAMATAVAAYLDAVRAAAPNMPIFLFGSMWNDSNLSAAQAQEAAIKTMVDARADKLLRFIPVKTSGAVNVISGQGTTTSPGGTGNSDWAFDGPTAHPSTPGAFWIARSIAERLREAAASMLAAVS